MSQAKTIKEGKAEIIFPDGKVFYNNVQEFNRDMSVAAITTWMKSYVRKKSKELDSEPITILEALSATGLRSFRYAKELPPPVQVIANDMDKVAVEHIRVNINHNSIVDGAVIPSLGDANLVMHQAASTKTKYDVVDLDPYGSAAPFIDAAVQCVADGGMLCITCTDMAVLAGGQYDACWGKYGVMPIPNAPYCHEMALRTLLQCIQNSAGRYKRYITPLASCSIDFYVRVFVRVSTSALETKRSSSLTGMVYHCPGCKSFHTHTIGKATFSKKGNPKITINSGPPVGQKCENCKAKFHIGGPVWLGPIHNKEFVAEWLKHIKESNTDTYGTHARMLGMVTVISEEIEAPFFYTIPTLCATIHVTTMPFIKIISALYAKKIKYSISHSQPNSLKIDAPPKVIWDIMRSWAKLNPPNVASIEKDIFAQTILEHNFEEADFSEIKEAEPLSRKIKLIRFQENPEKDWGPKPRATGSGRKRIGEENAITSKREKIEDENDSNTDFLEGHSYDRPKDEDI